MEIELSAARLRSWRLDDAASLVRHANNRRVSMNLRDAFPYPYNDADAAEWLERAVTRDPVTNFAIEVAGEAAGSVGLRLDTDIFSRTAEIGYWLGEAHWGKGIVTEAVRAISRYAFERFDLARIEAGVFERNPASMRVLEKNGFTLEGRLRQRVTKDGVTMDECLYALTREDWARLQP